MNRNSNEYPVGTVVKFIQTDLERTITLGETGTVVESFAPDTGRNVQLSTGNIVNVPVWYLAVPEAFCPDCGELVFNPPGRFGEDAAWKNHFEHCEAHALRMEFEEPSSELTVVVIKFHSADSPNTALYARILTGDVGNCSVSQLIQIWSRDTSHFIMDDWKLVTYAPIPF